MKEKIILKQSRMSGKRAIGEKFVVDSASKGKVVMWSTLKGNLAVMKWEEYVRLKKLDK